MSATCGNISRKQFLALVWERASHCFRCFQASKHYILLSRNFILGKVVINREKHNVSKVDSLTSIIDLWPEIDLPKSLYNNVQCSEYRFTCSAQCCPFLWIRCLSLPTFHARIIGCLLLNKRFIMNNSWDESLQIRISAVLTFTGFRCQRVWTIPLKLSGFLFPWPYQKTKVSSADTNVFVFFQQYRNKFIFYFCELAKHRVNKPLQLQLLIIRLLSLLINMMMHNIRKFNLGLEPASLGSLLSDAQK
jgi:hypothetical protein